jgi:hypothetical protein
MTRPTDLVTARKVLDEPEAIRLKAFLEGEGIDCEVLPYHASAFDGVRLLPRDWYWGEIRVLDRDIERARAVIADIESSQDKSEPGDPSSP